MPLQQSGGFNCVYSIYRYQDAVSGYIYHKNLSGLIHFARINWIIAGGSTWYFFHPPRSLHNKHDIWPYIGGWKCVFETISWWWWIEGFIRTHTMVALPSMPTVSMLVWNFLDMIYAQLNAMPSQYQMKIISAINTQNHPERFRTHGNFHV